MAKKSDHPWKAQDSKTLIVLLPVANTTAVTYHLKDSNNVSYLSHVEVTIAVRATERKNVKSPVSKSSHFQYKKLSNGNTKTLQWFVRHDKGHIDSMIVKIGLQAAETSALKLHVIDVIVFPTLSYTRGNNFHMFPFGCPGSQQWSLLRAKDNLFESLRNSPSNV